MIKLVELLTEKKKNPGLWANIHAKRRRGEKMRKKGAKGAPKPGTFKKIALKNKKKKKNGKKS